MPLKCYKKLVEVKYHTNEKPLPYELYRYDLDNKLDLNLKNNYNLLQTMQELFFSHMVSSCLKIKTVTISLTFNCYVKWNYLYKFLILFRLLL